MALICDGHHQLTAAYVQYGKASDHGLTHIAVKPFYPAAQDIGAIADCLNVYVFGSHTVNDGVKYFNIIVCVGGVLPVLVLD